MSKTKSLDFDFNNVAVFAKSIGEDKFIQMTKTMEQARANISEKQMKEKAQQKTYLIKDNDKDLVKIGKSKNPDERKKALKISSDNLELLYTIDNDVEKKLHDKYSKKRTFGEWFNLSKKDVKNIKDGEY